MRQAEGIGSGALAAALTLYAAFHAGAYFPDTVGIETTALLVVLALRVVVAERPFAGWSRGLAAAGAGLVLLACWTLVSLVWSHAPGRAIVELDRVLAYVLTLLVFGLTPWSALRARRAAAGVAGAAVVVAVAALGSRLAPDVFHTSANIVPDRLSFPLTYWNALALLAGIGLVLALHFASDLETAVVARVAAAAALPVLAVTLLLTYSRGGVAVVLAMVVVYLALARPAGAVATLLAVVPPTALALVAAYSADRLASSDPTSPAAAAQGHRVAVALAVCTGLAAGLELLVARRRIRLRVPGRGLGRPLGLVVAVVVIALIVAAAVKQVEGFSKRPSATTVADTRGRLTDPSGNGRSQYWHAALDAFSGEPVRGTGAGTYQLDWWLHRTVPQTVTEAHSLYLQVLAELGIVGLVLLLAGLAPVGAALARRMQRAGDPQKRDGAAVAGDAGHAALAAAVAVCAAGWALHAALDWDWQMPAVTFWLFALGGIALARSASGDPGPAPGAAVRAALGLALVAAAIFPALVAISQRELDSALDAYGRSDCAAAADHARTARSALAARSEPRAVLGWCAARAGRLAEATAHLNGAIARDRSDWEYHYSLAVVEAAAGADARREAEEALRLNPLQPELAQFAAADPQTQKRRAASARLFVNGLDYPPLGG